MAVPPAIVVPMGATPGRAAGEPGRPGEPEPAEPAPDGEQPEGPYFLTVATIEPRKNHLVALDAFEAAHDVVAEARWIVVGRPGWHHEEIAARLERAAGSGVEWRREVSDAELDRLYRGLATS